MYCIKCFKKKPLSAFTEYRPNHYHNWCKMCIKKTAICYPPKNDDQPHIIFDKEKK